MNTKRKIIYAISAIIAVAILTAVIREITLNRNQLPLEITHKIRNISARENEWEVATTAQPGDVLEHFVLIHLPQSYASPLKDISISSLGFDSKMYKKWTLGSSSEGISQGANDSKSADSLFSNDGLKVEKIRPGEFIDLKWQSMVSQSVSFKRRQAPLLETKISVGASSFSPDIKRTAVSLFSTIERSKITIEKDEKFYFPSVIGMNPRVAYEDIGTGVLIAGTDLKGIKSLRLYGSNKDLAWRLISNELLEAGIPERLASGDYKIEFIDAKGNVLGKMLDFKVIPTNKQAVVVNSTPSVIRAGQRRVIVLQGIRLAQDSYVTLQKSGANQIIVLENVKPINDRVISAQVPESIEKGEYSIFVWNREQEVKLVVK